MGSTRNTACLVAALCWLGLPLSQASAQAAPAPTATDTQVAPVPPAAPPSTPNEASPAAVPAAAPQAPQPVPMPAAPLPAPAAQPPAPAAVPLPPPATPTMEQFAPPPRRVVFLVPAKHPVRRPRVYGDAGAPFAVGMGMRLSWPADAGYGFAGIEETQRRFDLFASYDVFQPTSRVVVAAGAGFRTLLGGDGDRGEIHERTFLGDLTVRYTATSWLFPHVRAAAGAAYTDLSIRDENLSADGNLGVDFEKDDWTATGELGAGLTLRTKARTFETRSGHVSSLSFGLLVEGGYSLAAAMPVKLSPADSPSSGVPLTTTKLGTLDRSAPYLRIAAVARF